MDPDCRPALALAPHVRVCAVDEQVILLDLSVNRYIGLAGTSAACLADRVMGWPHVDRSVRHGVVPTDSVTDLLVARGWLVRAVALTGATDRPDDTLPDARQSLDADGSQHAAGLLTALRACRSAVAASWSLRMRSLAATTQDVALRKRKIGEQCSPASAEQLTRAVAAYLRTRPLLLSARDRCLHDSLTLVHFLASQRVVASWVIGVRVRPFAAHSWVQHGDLVLNDQHERVRAFRPILVV